MRAGQESAEAIVVKKAGESRKERRAEEPRDQPQNSGKERSEKSSETVLERQLKVTSRIGPEGKREWNSLANQQTELARHWPQRKTTIFPRCRRSGQFPIDPDV